MHCLTGETAAAATAAVSTCNASRTETQCPGAAQSGRDAAWLQYVQRAVQSGRPSRSRALWMRPAAEWFGQLSDRVLCAHAAPDSTPARPSWQPADAWITGYHGCLPEADSGFRTSPQKPLAAQQAPPGNVSGCSSTACTRWGTSSCCCSALSSPALYSVASCPGASAATVRIHHAAPAPSSSCGRSAIMPPEGWASYRATEPHPGAPRIEL